MKTYLIAVVCLFLGIGEVSHGQENRLGLWVLEGAGKVLILQNEITIDLPGLPEGAKPLTLVRIPAGSFMMGSTEGPNWSWCHEDNGHIFDINCEQPVHQVTIGSDFDMGKYEVTIAQYTAFLRSTGDESGVDWDDEHCPLLRSGGDYVLRNNTFGSDWNQPMVDVNWHGSVAFANWVQQVAGGTVTLPSESQWEYAARAVTTTRFSFGDSNNSPTGCSSCDLDSYAWWCGNSGSTTHPVGGKLPNAFGLFDVHGNVWEWCEDDWHGDYTGAPTDGTPWVDSPRGSSRVIRGGYWGLNARPCRSANRDRSFPDTSNIAFGFRIVRTQ